MLEQFAGFNDRLFPRAAGRPLGSLVSWLFDRLDGLDRQDLSVPPSALEFLVDCHNLVWFVLKNRVHVEPNAGTGFLRACRRLGEFIARFVGIWPASTSSPEAARATNPSLRPEEPPPAAVLCSEEGTRDSGFRVTAFFALWGAGRILGKRLQCVASNGTVPWAAILEQLTEPERNLLLSLVSRSSASQTLWPDLRQSVERQFGLPSQPSIRLRDPIAARLQRLTEFSQALLVRGMQPTVDQPYFDEILSPRVLQLFEHRRSVCNEFEADRRFDEKLLQHLRAIEDRFLAMMIAPRPECYDVVFPWDRDKFPPVDRRDCTLSPTVRTIITLCHNLLLLHTVEQQLKREPQVTGEELTERQQALQVTAEQTREMLPPACDSLNTIVPDLGDIQVTHIALVNLLPLLSEPLETESWTEALPQFSPEVRSAVLHLISLCPMMHLAKPEVRPLLREEGLPAHHSHILFASGRGDSLRRHLVGLLVERALRDRDWFCGPLRRMLAELLQGDQPANALFVVEFVGRLLDVVFGDVHRSCCLPTEGAPQASESATCRCQALLEDPRRAGVLLHLLVRLIRFRSALQPEDSSDRLGNRLRYLWYGLSRCCTDGVYRRPWPIDLQRMLRLFLLRLCENTFRQFGLPAQAFNTGDIELDEIERLGCGLFRDLVQDHLFRMGALDSRYRQWVGSLLTECFRDKPGWLSRITGRQGHFQRALWINGLLWPSPAPEMHDLNFEQIFHRCY